MGKVVKIENQNVFVDFGAKFPGVLKRNAPGVIRFEIIRSES